MDQGPEPTLLQPGRRHLVELAHAAVDVVAERHGIRLLHFKGPLAFRSFSGRPSGSGDVDILVEPGRSQDMTAALHEHGWHSPSANRRALINHATVLTHDSGFQCTVDIHHHIHGWERDPEETFRHLWERRTTGVVAGRRVTVPCRVDHAGLLILDAIRDRPANNSRAARKLRGVIEGLSPEEFAATVAVSEALGGDGALRASLPETVLRHGPDAATPGTDAHEALWRARSSSTTGLTRWLTRAMETSSWYRRVAILLRALIATPEYGERWSLGTTIAQSLRRIPRGIAQIPEVVASLRRPDTLGPLLDAETITASLHHPPASPGEVASADGAEGNASAATPLSTAHASTAHVPAALAPEEQESPVPFVGVLRLDTVANDTEALLLCALPDGPPMVVSGTAIDVWICAAEAAPGDSDDAIVAEVLRPYPEAPDSAGDEVRHTLHWLRNHHFLSPSATTFATEAPATPRGIS